MTSSSNDSPDLNFILNFKTTSSLWCFIKKAKFLKDLTTTPSNLLNFKTTLLLWCFNKKAKLYNILIREVMILIINNRNSVGWVENTRKLLAFSSVIIQIIIWQKRALKSELIIIMITMLILKTLMIMLFIMRKLWLQS